MPPPDGSFNVSLLHKIQSLYQKLYFLSRQISKRDKFGLWLKIENLCLNILELTITAALEARNNKLPILNSLRIKIENLKRLLRIAYELKIIEGKSYIALETDLQEISKMTSGWFRFVNK